MLKPLWLNHFGGTAIAVLSAKFIDLGFAVKT